MKGRLAGALAALAGAGLTLGQVKSRDWGWHLATLDRMLAERRIPWDDAFAYTSVGDYEPVHLVFQFVIGACVAAFDLSGLWVYRLVMAALISLALFALLRRRGAGAGVALALVALVLAGAHHRFLVRPHLFTTLGIVLLLDTLCAARRGALKHPARLVPLFLVWTNAHPGVVFGVLLAIGFVSVEAFRTWLDRARGVKSSMLPADLKRLVGWVAAGLGASLISPLGPRLYPYLLAHRDMQDRLDVVDIRPLSEFSFLWHEPVWLGAGLAFLGLALMFRYRRRVDPTLALASLAFTVLGVVTARELPLALILIATVLAPVVGRVTARRLLPRAREGLLALALVPLALAFAEIPQEPLGPGLRPVRYPVAACDWILRHRPQGRLYNTNGVGGYVVYRLAPRAPGGEGWLVYSDGRMPLFLDALELRKDWSKVEARYDPQILLIDWHHGPTAFHRCEGSPGFSERYALVHVSTGGKVYLKRGGVNQALIDAHGYRELTYKGFFWPGRIWHSPRGPARPLALPQDPRGLQLDVERAGASDPTLRHLPGRDPSKG